MFSHDPVDTCAIDDVARGSLGERDDRFDEYRIVERIEAPSAEPEASQPFAQRGVDPRINVQSARSENENPQYQAQHWDRGGEDWQPTMVCVVKTAIGQYRCQWGEAEPATDDRQRR